MATRIQFRRGTSSEWTSANPILAEGELALELDTGRFKVGVGTTSWNSLSYSSGLQGLQGTQGLQGLQGRQGTQGLQGLQGTQGTQGLQGVQGTQGLQGLQGRQGTQGLQGLQGLTGPIAGSNSQVIFNNNNVSAGATNFVYNATNQRVGIGTGSPQSILDILSSGSSVYVRNTSTTSTSSLFAADSDYFTNFGATFIEKKGTSAAGNIFSGIPNANLGTLVFQNANNALIYTNGGTPLIFGTLSLERMRISSDGNIGIGTNNPGSTLDVRSSTGTIRAQNYTGNFSVLLDGNANGPRVSFGVNADNSFMEFGAYNNINNLDTKNRDLKIFSTAAPNAFTLAQATGNIGINSTSPTATLTVQGNSIFTGILTARNAVTQDSISLNGRAGGTSSFNLSLTPTTLAASRTVTFQDVSGTVYVSGGTDIPLADGGTNASLTAVNGGVVYSTASAFAITAAGTSGQVLTSNGAAAAPTWQNAAGGAFAYDNTSNIYSCSITTVSARTSGAHNFFAGSTAGDSITSGCYNTFFGRYAGTATNTGSNNNFFGRGAGLANSSGSSNNFFGQNAGCCNSSGLHNNFFGCVAGGSNTTGCHNNYFGCGAGLNSSTGSYNNFFGTNIIGGFAGISGCHNNFFGSNVGCSITTGCYNNFMGRCAGSATNTGSNNNYFGKSAGFGNCSGSNNNYFGCGAGEFSGTNASHNNFFGCFAGYCSNSCHNIAVGALAGCCISSGAHNIFLGNYAGRSSQGCYNIFFGRSAGCANAFGNCNIFIGCYAGNCYTACCNNIVIGHGAAGSFLGFCGVNASNNIVIGNTCTTCFWTKMACKSFAATTVKWCSTTYELAADSSSQRFKTNIRPFLGGVEEILKLQAVVYNPIEDPNGADEVGFLAEQVAEVGLTQFISYDAEEKPLSVSYDRMIALVTNAIKELDAENKEMKQRLEQLENTLNNSS